MRPSGSGAWVHAAASTSPRRQSMSPGCSTPILLGLGRRDDVYSFESELGCGGEQMGVIRIYGLVAMQCSSRQMQRVRCSKVRRRRQDRKDLSYPFVDFRPGRKPRNRTRFLVGCKLPYESPILRQPNRLLPELAVKSGCRLSLAMPCTGHMIGRREQPHGFKSGVFQIQPHQVAGIEIIHLTGASRSSEIITVESRPPLSDDCTALKARVSVRRA